MTWIRLAVSCVIVVYWNVNADVAMVFLSLFHDTEKEWEGGATEKGREKGIRRRRNS